jgi:hypothetical protein
LVSNGKHIYDEQGNRLWNGMLFSSKKALLLNSILKNALAYYNAGVVAVNLKVVGLAPEKKFREFD